MYCSKCGKEISDDSKFCYNCGLIIDFIKSSKNIKKDSISPIDMDTSTKHQKAEEKIPITNNNQTISSTPLKTKYSLGWLVLLMFYGYGVSLYVKTNPFSGEIYSIIIIFLGFIGILPVYFWFRNYLIKKRFWKGHIASSSCMSGVISYLLVLSLVAGSIGAIGGYERGKEKRQFSKDFLIETEIIQKQELEFSNILMVTPESKKEIENYISTCDRYKIFLKVKRTHFNKLINYFNKMKLKSHNEKVLTDKINNLEKLINYMISSSVVATDALKSYNITGKEKYLEQANQIILEHQTLKNNVSKQIADIEKLL